MYKGMLELPSVDPIEEDFITSFKHSYTKYRLTVKLYHLQEIPENAIWIDLQKTDQAPLSTLVKKAIASLPSSYL
jgi:adenine-specific DNA glycosylase